MFSTDFWLWPQATSSLGVIEPCPGLLSETTNAVAHNRENVYDTVGVTANSLTAKTGPC